MLNKEEVCETYHHLEDEMISPFLKKIFISGTDLFSVKNYRVYHANTCKTCTKYFEGKNVDTTNKILKMGL